MEKKGIFGIGNALMDIQVFINTELLSTFGFNKGTMQLVDADTSARVLKGLTEYEKNCLPGGSCANTISIIASLGGQTCFLGSVSKDEYGRLYEKSLKNRGVTTCFNMNESGPTGTSIILTTEDKERTMLTNLGTCQNVMKSDVDTEVIKQVKVFHIAGYMWDTENQKKATLYAMEEAKKHNTLISFDIADPFLIQRNKEDFLKIIKEYVDILFGNQDEVCQLLDTDDPREAGRKLKDQTRITVVKLGMNGSCVFSHDREIPISIYPTEAVDTTGAGDSYAGGFLYGFVENHDLEKCGHMASLIASHIVSRAGLDLSAINPDEIKTRIIQGK